MLKLYGMKSKIITPALLFSFLLYSSISGIAQVAVSPGGSGAPAGSGVNGANNAGGAAAGLGCGGGGGSWWGGTGGSGKFGGGGGGAGGYFSLGTINWAGGDGGQGVVVIAYYNGASLVSAHVLTSGSSTTVPAGVTSAKVWAIGAGGGGGGSTDNDGTSGGSGAAGGVSYITKAVAPNDIISYVIGAGGLAGHGYVAATAGGNTAVTIAGTTIYGNGGGAGLINSATTATGGTFSGGDGGANGGNGNPKSGDVGGGGGAGIGNASGTTGGLDGGTGASAVDVSGLFAACAAASNPTVPSLSSFTPTAGLSGTVVTITGTGFTGSTSVKFGGVNAFSYTVNSATEIVATVDASCVTGSVTVVTPFVAVSKPIYFVTAPVAPTISNFSPASAQTGTLVTINGNHFLGTTSVTFGGTAASGFSIISDYQILATVGAGSNGSVNVQSSSGTGTYAGFTYVSTTQATAVSFSAVGQNNFTVNWTNGTAAKRVVFMKQAAGAITNPTDNTTYSASANWASKGTQLGSSGYYCIYNGTGSSVAVTGLNSGTTYVVQVFEYNGSAGAEKYFTSTTASNPNTQVTSGVLPVRWISFSGKHVNNGILLQWKVASEESMLAYTVQHSLDGQQWNPVAVIAVKQMNPAGNIYEWLHENNAESINYYRIAATNADGSKELTKVVLVTHAGSGKSPVINTQVKDLLYFNTETLQTIRLLNAAGQVMLRKNTVKGINTVDMQGLRNGIYYLLSVEGISKVIKY